MPEHLTLHTPRWWWISFLVGMAFVVLFRRVFPALIRWPEGVPDGTRAVLLLFGGILTGAAAQAGWMAVRRLRRTSRDG